MSRHRNISRSKSKLKAKQDVDCNDIQHSSVEDSIDSIPFQRLESPRPPSPVSFNFVPHTSTHSNTDNADVGSIDNDEPEPFASLNDHSESDYVDGDEGLRPPSQNSIASVIKHASSGLKHGFQEAKHMIGLCGVGVGVGANDHQFADGEIPDVYMNELPKFYRGVVPYQDSIPSRTNTTSSSSLSTHFDKQSQKDVKVESKRTSNHPTNNEKTIPFPQSIYPSANITPKNVDGHSQLSDIPNIPKDKSIPLRHSQSVPFKSEPVQHLFMRRSASTPTTFHIGQGRSAFGKVDGNNIRNRAATYSSPKSNSIAAKCMSDSKIQSRPKSVNDSAPEQSTLFNPIAASTPEKRWLSDHIVETKEKEDKSESSIDDAKDTSTTNIVTNNDDVSSVVSMYSKSNIMNSSKQRRIKERRKERRKMQKESTEMKKDTRTPNDSPSSDQCIDESKEYNNHSHDKMSSVDEKVDVSYISLGSEMEQLTIDQDPSTQRVDESVLTVPNPDFSTRNVPKSKPRNVESPPIPPTLYHKIVDEDQAHPSFMNPPLPLPHNRRSSKPFNSSTDRVETPPLSNTPQRLRGSFSPCSHDSALNSRTSRSGQSVNTTSQTISTFISCNASCNRSVTSSVAEADREVRDTNRKELKRREGVADLDGSISIQSSDTISTNAYLALTSSPAQLRDGANIHHDRFFGCNNSVGAMNSQSSNASSVGLSHNQNHSHYSPGMNGRNLNTMNARSPITVSSNSIANTNSSHSTSEDPPRFVSCSSKVVPINTNRAEIPPRSDQYDSSIGYTKLGSSDKRSKSRSSSRSSSSKSTKSKKSSGTKKKEKSWLYHKIGSAKVADNYGRATTPSPCNSYQTSPVKTPITPPNQFDYHPSELIDVQKPRVRRQLPMGNVIPGSKIVLVSPTENDRRKEILPRPVASFWPPNGRDQRAFQPTAILESVVTPEKASRQNHL